MIVLDKNISFDDVAAVVDPESITHMDCGGKTIDVRSTVPFAEASKFVETVSDLCFDNSGDYIPQVYDVAVAYAIIDTYTSIETPTDITALADVVYRSNIIENIRQYIDDVQIESLLDAVAKKIEYRIAINTSAAVNKSNDIINKIEEAEKMLEQVASGLGGEDVTKLVSAIADGKIDEKKLMEAYLDKKEES